MTDKEKNNKDFDLFQNDLFGSSESKPEPAKESQASPEPQPATSDKPDTTPIEPEPASTEPPSLTPDNPESTPDAHVLESTKTPSTTSDETETPSATPDSTENTEPVAAVQDEKKNKSEETAKLVTNQEKEPVPEKTEESRILPDTAFKEPEHGRKRFERLGHKEDKVHDSQHTAKMKKSLFRKKEKVVDTAHFGIILSSARESSGLEIDYIASETKIKKAYIHALENEDFDKLPQKVYIRAYIRKLGHLYGLPESQIAEVNATLMQDSSLLDEEVYSALVSLPDEDDDDLNARVKSLPSIIIPVLGILILLAVLIIGGWMGFSYFNNKPRTNSEDNNSTFDSAKLEKFEPDQLIKMSEMPLPD